MLTGREESVFDHELESLRSRVLEPITVRLYDYLSLPVPAAHNGVGVVPGLLEVARTADGKRKIKSGSSILGQDLWNQFCCGCRYRYPHGVSVRNELGRLDPICGRRYWTDFGNGGHVRI